MGKLRGYNRTSSPELRKAKLYLLRQASAAALQLQVVYSGCQSTRGCRSRHGCRNIFMLGIHNINLEEHNLGILLKRTQTSSSTSARLLRRAPNYKMKRWRKGTFKRSPFSYAPKWQNSEKDYQIRYIVSLKKIILVRRNNLLLK